MITRPFEILLSKFLKQINNQSNYIWAEMSVKAERIKIVGVWIDAN